LARLRQQLDQQLQHLQGGISKLANRLERRSLAQQTRAWGVELHEGMLAGRVQPRVLAQQARSWEFDLDEGMLDAGRLARVVINPLLALSYKRELDTEFRATVVSLLI